MRNDAVSIGVNPPHDVNVIIEVPVGGEPIKYEMDKEAGTLVVDRFLYTPMRYPGNYGFVPHTLSGDGDPLDALVLLDDPVYPGVWVEARPIGVLYMQDEAGEDAKLICVPPKEPRWANVEDIADLTPQLVEEIFEIVRELNRKEGVSFLLAEQNTNIALRYADSA